MTQTLRSKWRAEHLPSRTLVVAANVTAAYPLLLLAAIYGQWLLSWLMLGHQPRPSIDDPKDIVGASWMSSVTGLALVNFVPASCAAAVLNTMHFCSHENPGLRSSLRIVAILGLWVGAFLLLRADPGSVWSWWID